MDLRSGSCCWIRIRLITRIPPPDPGNLDPQGILSDAEGIRILPLDPNPIVNPDPAVGSGEF
jgi:hypothetical protein